MVASQKSLHVLRGVQVPLRWPWVNAQCATYFATDKTEIRLLVLFLGLGLSIGLPLKIFLLTPLEQCAGLPIVQYENKHQSALITNIATKKISKKRSYSNLSKQKRLFL